MPAQTDSRLARAFVSLTKRKAIAAGKQRVRIGRKFYEDCLVETLTSSEVFVAGGTGQSGGFKVHVAIADLGKAPKKFTPIQVEGDANELQVLNVNSVNGVTYEITAGDPATEGN